MPQSNDSVVCINHPAIPMTRMPGYSAFPQIRSSENLSPMSNKGIPVLIFYCEICGYMENYVGTKTGYWDVDHPSSRSTELDSVRFEQLAFHALQRAAAELHIFELKQNVKIKFSGNQTVEYDAIGFSKNGVIIFEIKGTSSKRHLESGAANLSRLITLYRNSFPNERIAGGFLVVPSTMGNLGVEAFLDTPILKVNPETGMVDDLSQVIQRQNLASPLGY